MLAILFLFIVDDLCDRESRRRNEERQQVVEKTSKNACTVYKGKWFNCKDHIHGHILNLS